MHAALALVVGAVRGFALRFFGAVGDLRRHGHRPGGWGIYVTHDLNSSFAPPALPSSCGCLVLTYCVLCLLFLEALLPTEKTDCMLLYPLLCVVARSGDEFK